MVFSGGCARGLWMETCVGRSISDPSQPDGTFRAMWKWCTTHDHGWGNSQYVFHIAYISPYSISYSLCFTWIPFTVKPRCISHCDACVLDALWLVCLSLFDSLWLYSFVSVLMAIPPHAYTFHSVELTSGRIFSSPQPLSLRE